MNGYFRDLLTSKIKCDQSNITEGWELTSNCRWILDATTIHLATHWHPESLVYFLALDVQDFCVTFDSYIVIQKFIRDLIRSNFSFWEAQLPNILSLKGEQKSAQIYGFVASKLQHLWTNYTSKGQYEMF